MLRLFKKKKKKESIQAQAWDDVIASALKYGETVADYLEDFKNGQQFFDFMYEDKTFRKVAEEQTSVNSKFV